MTNHFDCLTIQTFLINGITDLIQYKTLVISFFDICNSNIF